MGWNPANWSIVDQLQGQESGALNPNDLTAGFSSGGGYVQPTSQPSGTNVLGASTTQPFTVNDVTADGGALYFDTNTGQIQQSDVSPTQFAGPSQQQINETNRVNGLRSNFNTKKQGIFDSINQWGDNTAARYGLDVRDFGNKLKSGQDALNLRGANNEAGRIQGTAGILGMIGRGVRSAGTYLGGRNAGRSSAAGEIARAYGDVGRRQMSSVGNQYAAAEAQRGVDQTTFDNEANLGVDRFKQQMDEQINAQVASAQSALTDLDVQMQNASLPDRIAIDQEKNRIKSELIAKLQTFDQQARDARANARATDVNQNRGTAQSNLAQGQAPADMFSFTDQAPMQLQNSGPSASGLPIFTNNKRRLA